MTNQEPIVILMAEDDADDRLLAAEALEESRLMNELHCVNDGVELMDFLYRRDKYADLPLPKIGIILLDLNMPRMDGREALEHIKTDPTLRSIPVVILTTSKTEEDILLSYRMGVSGFVTKPVSFQGLVEVMKSLGDYWFEIVKLPNSENGQ
jgi:two-component system response regulator